MLHDVPPEECRVCHARDFRKSGRYHFDMRDLSPGGEPGWSRVEVQRYRCKNCDAHAPVDSSYRFGSHLMTRAYAEAIDEFKKTHSIDEVCKHFGISVNTQWQARKTLQKYLTEEWTMC